MSSSNATSRDEQESLGANNSTLALKVAFQISYTKDAFRTRRVWVVPQPRTAHPFVLPLGDSPTGILPCQARNHPIAGFCKSLAYKGIRQSDPCDVSNETAGTCPPTTLQPAQSDAGPAAPSPHPQQRAQGHRHDPGIVEFDVLVPSHEHAERRVAGGRFQKRAQAAGVAAGIDAAANFTSSGMRYSPAVSTKSTSGSPARSGKWWRRICRCRPGTPRRRFSAMRPARSARCGESLEARAVERHDFAKPTRAKSVIGHADLAVSEPAPETETERFDQADDQRVVQQLQVVLHPLPSGTSASSVRLSSPSHRLRPGACPAYRQAIPTSSSNTGRPARARRCAGRGR